MPRILILLAALLMGSITQAAQRPNIVLLIGDDQAWNDYGFMGHPTIQTPHLDRLAAESLTFTRGYVPTSLCRPSLATMITGLYPHQHKITSNDPPPVPKGTGRAPREPMLRFIDAAPALPRILGAHGYLSFQAGKWWEGNHRRGGFTAGMTHGDPARGGRHGDHGLKIGREGLGPVFEFIEQTGDRPFFLWYAPMLPHQPHNPPERLLAKYRDKTPSLHVARYWAMVEWFDETCGEVLRYLDEHGLRENTIVLYLVDNGWIQDENRPQFALRSKRSPHEGGIRTPILVRWPGKVVPRRDETTLASSIDLAPTVLAACGVQPPEPLPGLNLLDADALARREAVFGEIFDHDAVELGQPASGLQYRWTINGWWKLIAPHASRTAGPLELYDLQADPRETRNLAAEQPERAAQLLRAIDQWWPLDEKQP